MKTLNGNSLKSMFISGANNLYNHYQEVDALNVFPVPDGDTGMNMNLTVTSGCKEIEDKEDNNIFNMAKSFARGTLFGARGNSGVITSQIFRGFSQGLEGKITATPAQFSDALEKGVEVAYKAVLKPVEGTILTVVREGSHYLHDNVKNASSIEKALELFLKEARESLKRTPELLPVLKEVGVVDSGGTGLIYIFEGMLAAVNGKPVERHEASEAKEENPIVAAGASMEEDEFGYCTEFIMRLGNEEEGKKVFNEKRFTSILDSHGNSLVVVHDGDIVKVHVHTLTPGQVLTYAQQFGEFIKLKIENMTEQHHNLESGAKEKDAPKEEIEKPATPRKPYAMIAVSSGAGITEIFNEAGVEHVVTGGQTMNPSAEDFVKAIKEANADTVYIFPNNSNILMAASQAADMLAEEGQTTFVIPTKTILQGISSAIMFNPDAKPKENFKEMKSALSNIKSGEVTFSIRDTKINGMEVKKDDFMGIFEKDIVVTNKDKLEACKALIEKMVDDMTSVVTIIYGEDVSHEEALSIKKYCEEVHPDIDVDIREGNQPVYSFLLGAE
ncbi:MAG: DAK2 domain-containing protein [Bacilli bacterium]|nr:DAK2 domain-containing protein [Bacilli bacterium]